MNILFAGVPNGGREVYSAIMSKELDLPVLRLKGKNLDQNYREIVSNKHRDVLVVDSAIDSYLESFIFPPVYEGWDRIEKFEKHLTATTMLIIMVPKYDVYCKNQSSTYFEQYKSFIELYNMYYRNTNFKYKFRFEPDQQTEVQFIELFRNEATKMKSPLIPLEKIGI